MLLERNLVKENIKTLCIPWFTNPDIVTLDSSGI